MVSVLVITYNHEKWISKCLDSILAQKCDAEFEVIVGVDKGNDMTSKIVAGYDGRVNSIIYQENIGANQNYLNCLERCKFPLVAVCEGDDWWLDPYKLQKQLHYMSENPNCGMVFSDRVRINLEGEVVEEYQHKVYTHLDVLKGFIPSTQTVMYRKSIELCEFMRANIDFPSGDRLVAYYISLSRTIHHMKDLLAAYNSTGHGVWSKYNSKEQMLLSFKRYREFINVTCEYENLSGSRKFVRKCYCLLRNLYGSLRQGKIIELFQKLKIVLFHSAMRVNKR